MANIVIFIKGGLVQGAIGNEKNIECLIVDQDINDGEGVKLTDPRDGDEWEANIYNETVCNEPGRTEYFYQKYEEHYLI